MKQEISEKKLEQVSAGNGGWEDVAPTEADFLAYLATAGKSCPKCGNPITNAKVVSFGYSPREGKSFGFWCPCGQGVTVWYWYEADQWDWRFHD